LRGRHLAHPNYRFRGMVRRMPNKVILFPCVQQRETIFVRERLILNVGSLSYEMEMIAIFTPLPPKPVRQPELPATSNEGRKVPQPVADLSVPTTAKVIGRRTNRSPKVSSSGSKPPGKRKMFSAVTPPGRIT